MDACCPPLDTGFPSADAQDDFLRVRRRQVMSRLARRVGREPGDVDVILPYDEVVAALGYLEESYVGLKTVPLDAILGTVDRAKGFDRQFRPTTARVRARWERIANAVRRGEPMPPISLFQIGEVYFVRDGHHRVSVARALGRTDIDAYVVEVRTRVGADRTLRVDDLPKKSHERVFHERVPLPSRARGRIASTDAWDYGVLAGAVEAWAFRLMQDRAEFLDRRERRAAVVRRGVRARRRDAARGRHARRRHRDRRLPARRPRSAIASCARTSGARTCSPACARTSSAGARRRRPSCFVRALALRRSVGGVGGGVGRPRAARRRRTGRRRAAWSRRATACCARRP